MTATSADRSAGPAVRTASAAPTAAAAAAVVEERNEEAAPTSPVAPAPVSSAVARPVPITPP